jgi:hypothetical protein
MFGQKVHNNRGIRHKNKDLAVFFPLSSEFTWNMGTQHLEGLFEIYVFIQMAVVISCCFYIGF